jgi:hypothetical protein
MKCPCCFSVLTPVPQAFQCCGDCGVAHDEVASRFRGYDVTTVPVMMAPFGGATSADCGSCGRRTTVEACPYCHYQIPDNWRASTVTCVAMAGARASGKSCMIAVGVRQLELLVERHHQSLLRPQLTTQRLFESEYVEPLYDSGHVIPATAAVSAGRGASAAREPLIFRFTERVNGQSRGRVLVLRDVAGEDLELGASPEAFGFFARADAVIALIDPMAVRQIRDMLADLVPEPDRLGGDAVAVLSHVLRLMNNNTGERTSIPIAVVLSKFDALQKLRDVEGTIWSDVMGRPGSPLQRDRSLMTGAFDVDDGDLLHEEVTGLLDLLDAKSLVALLNESAQHYRFFVSSALGEFPEGESLDTSGIAPFRAVDPFKWALTFG